MWQSWLVLLLATVCLAQRQPSNNSGERQIRLEDIERDNLAASQKPVAPAPASAGAQVASSPPQGASSSVLIESVEQQGVTQQQLAAYQQQLLLQQLQQHYFAPTPITYGNFGGVPLMIIHSNHLGVGGPGNLPLQAYFVPEPQYVPQYNPALYQPNLRYTQPRTPLADLTYNSLALPRQPQNYPSASIVYAGTPLASSFQQPQTSQPVYNAYNALYQQRPEKQSFAAGVKSTPAPPLKPQSSTYSNPQLNSQALYTTNYKNFNYNQ